MKNYPSVSELLKAKAQRRKRLARLSFEEKIAIVNKWRKLTRNIRKTRALRTPKSLGEHNFASAPRRTAER